MASAGIKTSQPQYASKGLATVLAIGTAVPPNCYYQTDYPDFYFRVSKSDHKTQLKDKFKRICEKSMVKKRYLHLTESMLEENPNLGTYMDPSLDTRQDIAVVSTQTLAKEAIEKALKEWGQPKSKITHLVVHATNGIDIPGLDYHITQQLGLPLNVKRFMLYHQGCHAGGTVLCLAKDLAENNEGARVLVMCCELNDILSFQGPSDDNVSNLVGMAVVGDGAAALIVGANQVEPSSEFPLFELIFANQTILPVSDNVLQEQLREIGVSFSIKKEVPELIANNTEAILKTALASVGAVEDWNSLFWVMHRGGRAILDRTQEKLRLGEEKLSTSHHVLSEYGNMGSACVLFILDELQKRANKKGEMTTGEELDLGMLLGYGPGLTVEAIVLRGLPVKK